MIWQQEGLWTPLYKNHTPVVDSGKATLTSLDSTTFAANTFKVGDLIRVTGYVSSDVTGGAPGAFQIRLLLNSDTACAVNLNPATPQSLRFDTFLHVQGAASIITEAAAFTNAEININENVGPFEIATDITSAVLIGVSAAFDDVLQEATLHWWHIELCR